jgi:hypothetical protein
MICTPRPPVLKKLQKAYKLQPPPRNDTIPQNTQQFYTTKANPLDPLLFLPKQFFIIFNNNKKLGSLIATPSTILQFNTVIIDCVTG